MLAHDRKGRASSRALPNTPLVGGNRRSLFSLVPTYDLLNNQKTPGTSIYFIWFADVIQRRDLKALKACLEHPPGLTEYEDENSGTSFLHVAAKTGTWTMWEMLSSHTMFMKYLDKTDDRGTTPLAAACWYENITAVRMLVEHGANPKSYLKENRKTPLHFCANHDSSDICDIVLTDSRCKEIVDDLDGDGNSALAIAISKKSPVVDGLLAAGASLLVTNPVTGRNVFHVAVVFENYDFLQYLLVRIPDVEYLNHKDINDNTPLSLAIIMADSYTTLLILQYHSSPQLLENCQAHLHELVTENEEYVLNVITSYAPDPSFFEVFDAGGRTPLLTAVELKKISIISIFHKVGVNFNTLNLYTGDSVLHVAAYSHHKKTIEAIFNYVNYEELSIIENSMGLTAYETILGAGSYNIWKLWKQNSQIEFGFENSSEESALFISAKGNNYILLLAHLVSDKFYTYFDSNPTISEEELVRLELKRMVYPSDLFVAFGLTAEHRGWKLSPKQDHLFKRNAKGMTIFHACALGGNINCLRFLNNYCTLFRTNMQELDVGDNNGNTPLFYAALSGHQQVVEYLLSHGCNVCRVNCLGWSPLHIMIANKGLIDILNKVIKKCAKYSERQENTGKFLLSYELFQTESDNQMHIIWSMFENLRSNEHLEVLTNPVIQYFVLYKWHKIKPTISLRLFMKVMFVFSFTLYLFFKLCLIIQAHEALVTVFRWSSIFFACLEIFMNIPLMFFRKAPFMMNFVPPLATLAYFNINQHTRESLELAAVAVLLSWLTMILTSHVTKMSYQLAVLEKTIHAVIKLIPLVILVLIGFSLCFFTLFHEYYEYNNPLHAFLTLAINMKEGKIKIPAIPSNEEIEPMDSSHIPIFPFQIINSKAVTGNIELRSSIIEGSLLFIFRLLVIICAYNLLIDAAIKGVTEVEQMGQLQKLKNHVETLFFWEQLLNSKAYVFFSKLRITWIMVLPHSLRDQIRIPTEIDPVHNPVPEFDVTALKWIVHERKPEKVELKYFNQLYIESYLRYSHGKSEGSEK